jgi:septin family protein
MEKTPTERSQMIENSKQFNKLLSTRTDLFSSHQFLKRAYEQGQDIHTKATLLKKIRIPLIGSINTGKTTFMNSLIGMNLLESGSTITSRFTCVIRHADLDMPEIYSCKLKKYELQDGSTQCEFKEDKLLARGSVEIRKEVVRKNSKTMDSEDITEDDFLILKCRVNVLERLPSEYRDIIELIDVPGINDSYFSN